MDVEFRAIAIERGSNLIFMQKWEKSNSRAYTNANTNDSQQEDDLGAVLHEFIYNLLFKA